MESKKGLIFTGVVIVIILAALAVIFFSSNKVNKDEKVSDNVVVEENKGDVAGATTQNSEWVTGLAKALKEKGAVMYGAYWCGHCQNQKKMFGDAFQYVDYVECDAQGPNANPDECTAQGVEGYPTWIYGGQKYSGEQSLEKLAGLVGYEAAK